MHISWSGIVFTPSFSWHFSFSWQQLQLAGVSGGVQQQPQFFLTQQCTNFMMLLDRSDFHSWAAQTSWITWHRCFYDLEFDSFSSTFPITSHFKISQNQAKIQKKPLNPPIIKNKGKSGHFGKTSIGSFSELKKKINPNKKISHISRFILSIYAISGSVSSSLQNPPICLL